MYHDLFNLNYLQSLCQRYHLKPTAKYGQNFLIDPAPLEKMFAAAELKPDDTIVEIGPGFGALTLALSPRVGRVVALEIEKKLQPYWEEQLKQQKNLEIVWGNALREIQQSHSAGSGQAADSAISQQYKVVANLPYQITSALIRAFLEASHPPQLMVLMVQREVAERICARPGEMSLLSVAVQYYAAPEIIALVPRQAFWPEPKVDSAILKVKVKSKKFTPSQAEGENGVKKKFAREFFRVVKAGFSNRRKLLIKNLAAVAGKGQQTELGRIFGTWSLPPTVRAQELSVAQWEELTKILLG
ncbi:MAG: ribosomal RNA small subunit methyltransferase A [Candidatus Magasanikbacteria bacterium]|nr:ribosomal RNA small subunit methyltransferase A [Candidatus Magasanikbacteria bacterium]